MPPTSQPFAFMTYNILVGGKERMPAIEAVIRHTAPDVVGIQEANDPDAVRALAARLGMECVVGYARTGFHVALLSRWPIRAWANYGRPVFQKGLLEAVIDLPGEPQPWHCFVAHLTAEFYRVPASERQRLHEAQTIIACMAEARAREAPHLLMGDFNTLAPGEPFNAVGLLERVVELDAERARTQAQLHGQPHLKYIVPPALHPFIPLIRRIPETPWLARICNGAARRIFPRWTIPALYAAGYIDCLRATYAAPDVPPTCPLPRPTGRIDYVWAHPTLAARLVGCTVVADAPDCPVNAASDHRPVLAHFARIPAAPEAATPEAAHLAAALVE
jgi:endonuclease/exonuclease/phosphatase family metal-dependent hydrolase